MRVLRDPVSGLSHGLGLVFALVGTGWLLAQARGAAMVTTYMIYAACLVALYTASTVYHLVPGSERIVKRLQLLDHAAIFLFVAGTSTPVLFHALAGGKRVLMLALLWGLAVAGVTITLLWRSAPRVITTAMYVGMGWSVVLVGPTLMASLSPACSALVIAGGVVYTIGAIVYATKWPNPRPPVFGFHEVWHMFVLGGSALHFAAIALLA
jgi:hemolysin III